MEKLPNFDPHNFTREQLQQVRKCLWELQRYAIIDVQPPMWRDENTIGGGGGAEEIGFWFNITGVGSADGYYTGVEVSMQSDGTWLAVDGGRGTAEGDEVSEASLTTGIAVDGSVYVWVWIVIDNAGGEWWVFQASGKTGMFPVALTQDAGSPTLGSKTTQCNYTYTVKSLDGATTYGTAKTPLRPRPTVGLMICPCTYGEGFYDNSGTFQLYDALETEEEGC